MNLEKVPSVRLQFQREDLRRKRVCVRNPYNPVQVSRYKIHPEVVDAIGFCTKNPEPFFPYLDLVKDYGQFWYVTMTSYGKEIEPKVPDKERVMESFRYLSKRVGIHG